MILPLVKSSINTLLGPFGLEVQTLRKARAEANRLARLEAEGHWTVPRYTEGINLDAAASLGFFETCVAPYMADIRRIPKLPDRMPGGYYFGNEYFSHFDAEVLYGVLRSQKLKTIVEVGSGYSTLLMREAVRDGNLSTRIMCIDPCPRTEVRDAADEHLAMNLEDYSSEAACALLADRGGLFIDSSHLVRTGGDVVRLFLEIVPKIPSGTLVHVHDIFLPFDYPIDWVVNKGWGWNEQYLVHAFLCFNESFEIVWPARYMWEFHRSALQGYFDVDLGQANPSSLWIRRV